MPVANKKLPSLFMTWTQVLQFVVVQEERPPLRDLPFTIASNN